MIRAGLKHIRIKPGGDQLQMAINASGMWWLPPRDGEEIRPLAGELRLAGTERATLHITGSWDSDEPLVRFSADLDELTQEDLAEFERLAAEAAESAHAESDVPLMRTLDRWSFPLAIPVVHGVTHGQLVSLLSVREVDRNDASLPGFSESTFNVQYILYGAHTRPLDVQTYDVAILEFDSLGDWIAGALDTGEHSEQTRLRETSVATATLDDGSLVELQYVRSGSANRDELRHSRRPIVTIRPMTSCTLTELLKTYAIPLGNMLTTAAARPSAVATITLHSEALVHSGHPQIIDVFYPGMPPVPPMMHPNTVLAPLSELDFATFIPAWFATHERRVVAADFAYALRYDEVVHPGMRIAYAAAAAAALHASRPEGARTPFLSKQVAVDVILGQFPRSEHDLLKQRLSHLNDASFRSRVRALVNEMAETVQAFIPKPKAWITALVDARNDVAHGNASRGSEVRMIALSEACGHLVELHLLREAGVPDELLRARLPGTRHQRLVTMHAELYLSDLQG